MLTEFHVTKTDQNKINFIKIRLEPTQLAKCAETVSLRVLCMSVD